jgi:hypothetical protein
MRKGGPMIKKKLTPLVLLCCLLIGPTACTRAIVAGAAAVGVGVGSYFYVKGELERDYHVPIARVWQATLQAVEELNLSIESKEHDAFYGKIKGTMADGTDFKIELKRESENLTNVGVRIGAFGDKTKSEAIHDKIHSNL